MTHYYNFQQMERRCAMRVSEFYNEPGFARVECEDGMYLYQDNGAAVLAVAHLDTVIDNGAFKIKRKKKDTIIHSPALDDRLGAYMLLDLMPAMGYAYDILLTENEEHCNSTAQYFETDKKYNWSFSLDRAGTDVVMYQFEDESTCALVESCGARIGTGSYSCIADLERLGCKGFNWGIGYHENHSIHAYARLSEVNDNLKAFTRFYNAHKDTHLVHTPDENGYLYSSARARWFGYGSYAQSQDDYAKWAMRGIDKDAPYGWIECRECGEWARDDSSYDDHEGLCRECYYWYLNQKGYADREDILA